MSKKNIYNLIGVIIIIGGGIFIAIYRGKKLDRTYKISTATFSVVDNGIRGSPEVFVDFYFRINNENKKGKTAINNTNSINDFEFLDSLLKNQTLPVIYQNDNPGNNRMLFTKKECEKYKVQLSTKEDRIINEIDSLVKSEK